MMTDALHQSPAPMRAAVGAVAAAALLGSPAGLGRADHSQSVDGLMARCTTVNVATLPADTQARYGIEGGEDTGLISCVVQKTSVGVRPQNTAAEVQAEYHPIGQAPQPVDMREVLQEDLVTYLGTYPVEGSHPLQFSVDIVVEGVGTVTMNFDDQAPRQ